jgi:glyoxylase-like metal-dependent hydrolase (beta-lactamase superfamily II)
MTPQQTTTLTWHTFVAPPVPIRTNDPPPGHTHRSWSPITATLIAGERDAVVVDPLLTIKQGRALADWIASTGKQLTTVYVTHGHGDHWFGLSAIRERFPEVRALARPQVVARMRQQASRESLGRFWVPIFPGQITDDLAVAEPLNGASFVLEGNELIAIDVGHSDTDDSTILHVPALGLVVAGDVAYNDVHQYLAESDHHKRQAWIAALDVIDALHPRAVIAGHKRAGRDDDPRIVEETRQYLRDFDRVAESTSTARQLYDQMLALYPNRANPGALWFSARTLKPDADKPRRLERTSTLGMQML